MKDITICVMSCGELTLNKCRISLRQFEGNVIFQEVTNVFPQIKALNQMIDQVETDYLVPVDADMVLDYDAWPRIQQAINKHRHNDQWHSILFNLWDTLTERQILALKILRSRIVKEYPFIESATPDVEHYSRLTANGFTCIQDYLKQRPIGKHIVRGKHFCYNKYRDIYQTYRSHNFDWDSGAFIGGTDLRERAKAHFDFFLYKWVVTDNLDYMHCIAGMMDGILSPVEHKSKTLMNRCYLIETQQAVTQFMNWYMQPLLDQKSGYLLF